jgi:nucleoporin GLE1
MKKIVDLLKESLNTVPSPGIDPSTFMVTKPDPADGAANNRDTLPALFLYLLNIFSKAVVGQFIDEAGVAPKTADPIGVVAVSVFSQVEFFWRNKPLIDILISKIRVVCPVLFGLRGNEKTEEGRARLGWKKNDGNWVGEQVHSARMAGLGVGYAALCLRDFSKSRLQNPWPPTHYWQAIASIVSTPPDQASSTQYMVLRAMIENYEEKFMSFYGNAARAALRVALVDFPGRAPEHSVAVSSLEVLADKLKRDMGLDLRL